MIGSSSEAPSPIYVFTTISLAAFLAMFFFLRSPHSQYNAYVTITASESSHDEDPGRFVSELRDQLLNAEHVRDSLVNAGMLSGDANQQMLAIAEEISSRMRVLPAQSKGKNSARLVLLTEHPEVGGKLLKQMAADAESEVAGKFLASPPLASRVPGTAITPSNLLVLLLSSSLVGVGGLVLREQSLGSPVLFTENEVTQVSKLPVLANFSNATDPRRDQTIAWRKGTSWAIRGAEFAVSAAILLMLFNAATSRPFVNLLVTDPLAAYSQAIGVLPG